MLSPKILDSTKISQNNWQQGASLFIDSTKDIYVRTQYGDQQLRLKDGTYIILSQDCDIVNNCLEKEPVIEIIEARPMQQCNPEVSSGKNPRQLHLGGENYALEFFPYKRLFISRHYLEIIPASEIKIEGSQLKILTRWIFKRTVRAAFPDSFNRRISTKNIKRIKQILGNEAKESLGLFVRLASKEELHNNQTYKILIKMLVSKATFDNEQALLRIEEGFNQIITLFYKIDGIEVIEGSQVQSMDDISAHRFLELQQWDFDYISFSNNEDGEIIAEELI